MPMDVPDDDFWNLVAAYIDASDPEALLRNSESALAERVVRHVQSCGLCQRRRITGAKPPTHGERHDPREGS
jgi:hypothetical protein